MAGKRNFSVVTVTTNLTERQASAMISEISKAKNKLAPNSRSTAAMSSSADGIRSLFQRSFKQLSDK